MHQLLFLRHAKATAASPGLPDEARPLAARGREDALAIGGAMRARRLLPDLVLVSSARRTRETLAALEPWDETPLIEPLDRLYLASASQILDILREVSETVRSVLVIGHNPGLHECALQLADASGNEFRARLEAGLPTGTLLEFAYGGAWEALGVGRARLTRFLSPRDLTTAAR
jgi:phosphohistidine phosphatase